MENPSCSHTTYAHSLSAGGGHIIIQVYHEEKSSQEQMESSPKVQTIHSQE